MVGPDMKEVSLKDPEITGYENIRVDNGLLDHLCKHAENVIGVADCYIFGEDITITFEDCSGKDFIDLLKSVEDYGIDLGKVQVRADGDGWVVVDLIAE
ncbi:MAG: hypothetical protein ACLFVI_06845 [Archaeoglobaceae archaeon]